MIETKLSSAKGMQRKIERAVLLEARIHENEKTRRAVYLRACHYAIKQ